EGLAEVLVGADIGFHRLEIFESRFNDCFASGQRTRQWSNSIMDLEERLVGEVEDVVEAFAGYGLLAIRFVTLGEGECALLVRKGALPVFRGAGGFCLGALADSDLALGVGNGASCFRTPCLGER